MDTFSLDVTAYGRQYQEKFVIIVCGKETVSNPVNKFTFFHNLSIITVDPEDAFSFDFSAVSNNQAYKDKCLDSNNWEIYSDANCNNLFNDANTVIKDSTSTPVLKIKPPTTKGWNIFYVGKSSNGKV